MKLKVYTYLILKENETGLRSAKQNRNLTVPEIFLVFLVSL